LTPFLPKEEIAGCTLVLGGDGRYFNKEAAQVLVHLWAEIIQKEEMQIEERNCTRKETSGMPERKYRMNKSKMNTYATAHTITQEVVAHRIHFFRLPAMHGKFLFMHLDGIPVTCMAATWVNRRSSRSQLGTEWARSSLAGAYVLRHAGMAQTCLVPSSWHSVPVVDIFLKRRKKRKEKKKTQCMQSLAVRPAAGRAFHSRKAVSRPR